MSTQRRRKLVAYWAVLARPRLEIPIRNSDRSVDEIQAEHSFHRFQRAHVTWVAKSRMLFSYLNRLLAGLLLDCRSEATNWPTQTEISFTCPLRERERTRNSSVSLVWEGSARGWLTR